MPFLFRSENPDKSGPVPIYRRAFRYIGTCREKQRLPNTESERVYLIFMIHYKTELSNAGLLAAKRCPRCGRIIRFVP